MKDDDLLTAILGSGLIERALAEGKDLSKAKIKLEVSGSTMEVVLRDEKGNVIGSSRTSLNVSASSSSPAAIDVLDIIGGKNNPSATVDKGRTSYMQSSGAYGPGKSR